MKQHYHQRQCGSCCCHERHNQIIILFIVLIINSTFDFNTISNLQAYCWIVLPKLKRFPYIGIISERRIKHTTSLSLFRRQQRRQQQQTLPSPPYIQVVSDVDDTLKSSGGVQIFNIALGGIDVQYKRNTIYPGVAEFMLQLSYGPTYNNKNTISSKSSSNNQVTTSITPKIAILTARAYELKLFLEMKNNDTIPKLFHTVGIKYLNINDWGIGPILYGSIIEWILQNRKGLRKFYNFEQLLSLTQYRNHHNITTSSSTTPLLNYIYVGDTGEYDEEAGIAMLYEYPQYVRAIFLHVVSNNINNQTNITIPSTIYIQGRPIIYFRTYIGAAISAVHYGFISIDGLQCIMNAVSLLLNDTNHTPPFTTDQRYELQRDMDRANQLIKFLT